MYHLGVVPVGGGVCRVSGVVGWMVGVEGVLRRNRQKGQKGKKF